jgi:hypothetical protein
MDSVRLNGLSAYDNIKLEKNKAYNAEVFIHNFENDTLTCYWEILYESTDLGVGGDHENKPENLDGLIQDHNSFSIEMRAPAEEGAFRLFVYVSDANNKVATANIPFYVK